MNKYLELIIEEANKAFINDEVPIGCCIIRNGEVISTNHNTKNSTNDPINHAEILCIKEATQLINNWRLNDCDLYVTLFPCPMCMSAIRQARIKNVYYICDNLNSDYMKIGTEIATITDINPKVNLIKINDDKYEKLLSNFYLKRR